MLTDSERQLADFLAHTVRELRELQETGRLLDPESRAEVDFLEHELRAAETRLAGRSRPETPSQES